jgi:integrase
MATLYQPKIVEYRMPDGSTRTPDGRKVRKDTPGAVRHVTVSPMWWGRYRDAEGNRHQIPLDEKKTTARNMLEEKTRDSRLRALDIKPPEPAPDPFAEHQARALLEHLTDFAGHLRAKGDTPEHIDKTVSRITTLFAGCRFVLPPDLDSVKVGDWLCNLRSSQGPAALPDDVEEFTQREAALILGLAPHAVGRAVARLTLPATGNGKARRYPRATVQALAEHQARGASPETVNHYVRAVRAFCRWMTKKQRLPWNPLDSLPLVNTATDRRHDRRELSAVELTRLLSATRSGKRVFRKLTGEDRFMLYATACGTGFRADGLASLTPEAFDLGGEAPVVVLAARRNKSRKVREQPLPADVAELLRGYLASRPAGKPVWPGAWSTHAAEMMRGDLAAADIPYTIEGPDGPLFADFHALRHSYITALANGGVDLATAQDLAGHSTPVLTKRYTHRHLGDRAKAISKLPAFLPITNEE